MIEELKDFSEKSWKSYSTPQDEDLSFKLHNIIFGQNGQGKTALANGLAKMAEEKDGIPCVRLYNGEYVDRTMRLENDPGAIKGVVAHFGTKNVDIDREIRANLDKINLLNKDIESLSKDEARFVAEIEECIDETRRSKKGSLTIKNKPEFRNPSKDKRGEIEKWIADYEGAKKRFPGIDFSHPPSNSDLERQKEQLESAIFTPIEPISEDDAASYAESLAFVPDSETVPISRVIEWIDRGIELHEKDDSTTCKFCGSSLDLPAIKSRVEAYRRNKQAIMSYRISKLLKTIRDSTKNEQAVMSAIRLVFDESSESFDEMADRVNAAFKSMHSLEEQIALKDENLEETIEVGAEDILKSFEELVVVEQEVINALNGAIQERVEQIDRASSIVKGAIGLALKTDKMVSSKLDQIDDCRKGIEDKQKEIEKAKSSNSDLESQKEDIYAYASFLNKVLEDLQLPFSLKCDERVYRLVLRNEEESLTVDRISEGEKNLLALIYFYFNLYEDDDQQMLNPDISYIIIDDPASSMDSPNRFYVLSLLKSLLQSKEGPQVFILTHVWDDFCELSYKKEKLKNMALLEIRKNANCSALYRCRTNISPYKQLFKEINDFANLRSGDSEIDKLSLHMPNAMRRVLEDYVANHAVNSRGVSSGATNTVGSALWNSQKDWDSASSTEKSKVERLISITNVFSHKFNRGASSNEIHDAAKFMMLRIKEHDQMHYIAMTSGF